VTGPTTLVRRVADLLANYGPPVLIEQFLSGREFTVALIETPQLVSLPITEVQFSPSAAVPWPILSYAAKWHPGSFEYEGTDMLRAVPLPAALAEALVGLAIKAYRALDCRDYGRIDLRMTETGEPMILEVNANPDMVPTACFARSLEAAGIDRARLLVELVHQAAARGKLPCIQR
jgi:D-alanine-D-alanine ligase